jgi:hypothetical protein
MKGLGRIILQIIHHFRFFLCGNLKVLMNLYMETGEARGRVVVEALCYKPEGRGIASR